MSEIDINKLREEITADVNESKSLLSSLKEKLKSVYEIAKNHQKEQAGNTTQTTTATKTPYSEENIKSINSIQKECFLTTMKLYEKSRDTFMKLDNSQKYVKQVKENTEKQVHSIQRVENELNMLNNAFKNMNSYSMPKYSSIQFLTLNEYHQKLNGTEESDSQQTNDEGKQADSQSVPNDSQDQSEKKEETSKAKDTEIDAPQPENKAKENYESSKKFLEEEYKLRKRLKTDIDSLKRVYQDKENSFYEEKKFLDRIETNDFVPLKKALQSLQTDLNKELTTIEGEKASP